MKWEDQEDVSNFTQAWQELSVPSTGRHQQQVSVHFFYFSKFSPQPSVNKQICNDIWPVFGRLRPTSQDYAGVALDLEGVAFDIFWKSVTASDIKDS